MSEGRKDDAAKPRVDLLDADFLLMVGNVMGFGAQKYAAHNWRGGIAYSRLIAAALRHLLAILKGEDLDPESGFPHTAHLGCCVMFLHWMMANRKDLDDRYKNEQHSDLDNVSNVAGSWVEVSLPERPQSILDRIRNSLNK